MIARFAFDEPCVVVPASLALKLFDGLRLDALRARARDLEPDVSELLLSWKVVAEMERERTGGSGRQSQGSARRDASACPEARLPSGRKWADAGFMTTGEVAVMAGRTTRAVRLAAAEGRLRGERVDGRWQFNSSDVAAWAA